MIKIILKYLIIYLFLLKPAFAERVNVFDFTKEELQTLEVRKVRGADNKTEYIPGLEYIPFYYLLLLLFLPQEFGVLPW